MKLSEKAGKKLVSLDKSAELKKDNEFINREPKPFKPMIGKDMRR